MSLHGPLSFPLILVIVKYLVGIDDALDLFAEHALGGILGLLANGLFADDEIIALDGVNTAVPGKFATTNRI